MATNLVLAQGENGSEWVPASEAVTLPEVPLGTGNIVVPETVRWLTEIRNGGGVPTRIRTIEGTEAGAYVTYDCTPFPQYATEDGYVYLDWSGCTVRHRDDAEHPIFAQLSAADRARLITTVDGGDKAPVASSREQ